MTAESDLQAGAANAIAIAEEDQYLVEWSRAAPLKLFLTEKLHSAALGFAEQGKLKELAYLLDKVHMPAPAPWRQRVTSVFGGQHCIAAAAHGQIQTLAWLQEHVRKEQWPSHISTCAINNHQHDVIEWLHAHSKLECAWRSGSREAFCRGNLDMLKLLRSFDPPIPWDDDGVAGAATHSHLEVIQWALCQDPPFQLNSSAYYFAAWEGHVHVLRWLLQQEPGPSHLEDAFYSVESNTLSAPVVLLLGEHNVPLNDCLAEDLVAACRNFCTLHGLVRWCRRTFVDVTRDTRRASEFRPIARGGRELLVNLAKLPEPSGQLASGNFE